jgi:hypothetical protein
MPRQGCLLVFATGFLVMPYCLADFVPISVSEQVQGSGNILLCPFGLTEDCLNNNFDFAASNSASGPYQISKSGQAALSAQGFINSDISVDATAQQTSDVSGANISVNMATQPEMDGTAYPVSANVTVSNQFLLLFNLTSPAIVHLTGSIDAYAIGGFYYNGLALGDAQFLFTGPGLQFEQDPCGEGFCFPGNLTFDEQFLLNPGTYTFSAFTDASIAAEFFIDGAPPTTADLSVNADFTPVPETEPRWMAMVLAALIVIKCRAAALTGGRV